MHRLDRLSRKVAHFVALLERLPSRGVALSIVAWPELGASAHDALVLNLLASFAEFERELIRERLTEARAAFKRRGRRVAGAVPNGYTTDPFSKQLVPHGGKGTGASLRTKSAAQTRMFHSLEAASDLNIGATVA